MPATSDIPEQRILGCRYRLLHEAGRGGMGVVYVAYDLKLDRKVAVKILHDESSPRWLGDHSRSTDARALLREAQTLAQLSHENIVAVYDVASDDLHPYIAMELLTGDPLPDWIATCTPLRRAIVELSIVAAEGLSHAHSAGYCHRDFKPDNLIVTADGRPVIVDFGLSEVISSFDAHSLRSRGEAAPDEGAERRRIAGTLAYMAPEQLLGNAADARSDQFSFCMVLYEALLGQLPFSRLRDLSTAAAIERGRQEIEPCEEFFRLPVRWREALLRGLAIDPEGRFPNMRLLAAALREPPAREVSRWPLLVTASLATLAWTAPWWMPQPQPCAGRAKVVDIRSGNRITAVRDQFLTTGRVYAQESWTRVESFAEDYVDRWLEARDEICHPNAQVLDAQLDLQLQCLSRAREQYSTLVGIASSADEGIVQKSVEAFASLSDPTECVDADALAKSSLEPDDPHLRRRVASVRDKAAELEVQVWAGDDTDASPKIDSLLQSAHETGYAPLLTEIYHLASEVAIMQGERRRALEFARASVVWGTRAGHSIEQASAMAQLFWTQGYLNGQMSAALQLLPLTKAALHRAENSPEIHVRLTRMEALVRDALGDVDAAEILHRASISLARRHLGEQSVATALALLNYGLHDSLQGNHDQAIASIQRAIVLASQALGSTHPRLAVFHNNLRMALIHNGQLRSAHAAQQDAIKICVGTYGSNRMECAPYQITLHILIEPSLGKYVMAECGTRSVYETQLEVGQRGHPGIPWAGTMLAEIMLLRGEVQAALGVAHEALDSIRAEPNVLSRPLSTSLRVLATAELAAGRTNSALSRLHECKLALNRGHGEHMLERPRVSRVLGHAHLAAGNIDAAIQAHTQTKMLSLAVWAPNNIYMAETHQAMATSLLAAHRLHEAQTEIERAVEITTSYLGPNNHVLTPLLTLRAAILEQLGQLEQSHADLTRARTIFDPTEVRQDQLAPTTFALARVEMVLAGNTPQRRAKALTWALEAKSAYETWDFPPRAKLAEIKTWLRHHQR